MIGKRAIPVALVASFSLALFTQLTHILSVPGLHFDEAWQGLYAHRIASEPGFWPLLAMNGYTTPVLHYILAAVFKIFGPTLGAMRGTFAFMNLTSLALFVALFLKLKRPLAAVWFALFWALLPLSVHLHRFYVEMTGFHSLCLAAFCWGIGLWKSRPTLSTGLILGSYVLGTYSHVIFVVVLFSTILVAPYFQVFFTRRVLGTVAAAAAGTIPLAVSMHLDLHKKSSLAFVLVLVILTAWATLAAGNPARVSQQRIRLFSKWTLRLFCAVAVPFSVLYVGLLWNGFWAFAQVTGELRADWVSLNAFLFVGAFLWAAKTIVSSRNQDLVTDFLWATLLAVFVLSSLLMFKQSARYYTIATIVGMGCCAITLSQIRNRALTSTLIAIFVGWNLFAFHNHYIVPFETHGAFDREFKLMMFRDSARDFRPFQKAFAWAEAQGCGHNLGWTEDDRTLRPMQFLGLASPVSEKPCPWRKGAIYFHHIPERLEGHMLTVRLVKTELTWGDLAFWELKEEQQQKQ